MKVYFVRHGETDFNRRHLHQDADTPLNNLGKQQAQEVARVLASVEPTHLYVSPFKRAAETGEQIARATNLDPRPLDLVVELIRPTKLVGKSHFSWQSFLFIYNWFFNKNEEYWQEVGGESRATFLKRIVDTKDKLETLPKDAVVIVVSHSVFINFFVAHICDERPLSIIKAALCLLKIVRLDNSSLVHIEVDKTAPENTCPWTVIHFDDDGHVKR